MTKPMKCRPKRRGFKQSHARIFDALNVTSAQEVGNAYGVYRQVYWPAQQNTTFQFARAWDEWGIT